MFAFAIYITYTRLHGTRDICKYIDSADMYEVNNFCDKESFLTDVPASLTNARRSCESVTKRQNVKTGCHESRGEYSCLKTSSFLFMKRKIVRNGKTVVTPSVIRRLSIRRIRRNSPARARAHAIIGPFIAPCNYTALINHSSNSHYHTAYLIPSSARVAFTVPLRDISCRVSAVAAQIMSRGGWGAGGTVRR